MKPIDLSFLESDYSVVVKGELFDSKDPVVLSEDLLEIDLQSGRAIDVGWYPEHDPQGQYRVLLYRGHTGYPLKEFRTTEVHETIDKIVVLIESDQVDVVVFETSASLGETVVDHYG